MSEPTSHDLYGAETMEFGPGATAHEPTPTGDFGPRRGRKALVGVAVLAVGGALAGGAFAAQQFLSGGGPQPEDVLPGTAVAFAKVDLDPSAGQKVNALRLLSKFPQAKADGKDLKAALLEEAFDGNDYGLTYRTDIAPWLGDRAGIAAVPVPSRADASGFTALAAIQVTDRDKADTVLARAQKAIEAENDKTYAPPASISAAPGTNTAAPPAHAYQPDVFAYTFVDDFVLLAESQKELDAVDLDTAGTLTDDPAFAKAAAAADVGDQIGYGWFDVNKFYAAAPGDTQREYTDLYGDVAPTGSVTVGVHVEPDYVEAVGQVSDVTVPTLTFNLDTHPGLGLVQRLPAETVLGAAQVNDLGPAVTALWHQYRALDRGVTGSWFDDVEGQAEEMGLKLPDDIATVLGTELALGVYGPTSSAHGTGDAFGGILTTTTEDGGKAAGIVGPLLSLTGEPDLSTAVTDGGYAVASDRHFLDQATRPTGRTLGDDPSFAKAVADPEDANAVVYVNLNRLLRLFDGEDAGDWDALDAAALTADADTHGGTFTYRLTTR